MSYARFLKYDVYVYMDSRGKLACCGCLLSDQWYYDTTEEMVAHLAEHRTAGDHLPDDIEEALWEDDEDNFVNYQRCMVDGCEERATCGSPTDDGYIWSCDIKHGKMLGGFSEWL